MKGRVRKRAFFLQVDEGKVLMLEIQWGYRQIAGGAIPNWQTEGLEFMKIIMQLEDVIRARLLSGREGTAGNRGTIKGQDFQVEYTFKKRHVKQVLLKRSQKLMDMRKLKGGAKASKSLENPAKCQSDDEDHSDGGYTSLTFLPEKLIATVHPLTTNGLEVTSEQHLRDKPTKAARGISKYFNTEDQVTESARKKQQKLQSIAKRVKDDGSSAAAETKISMESEGATARPERKPLRVSTKPSATSCEDNLENKNEKEKPSATSQKRTRSQTDSENEEKHSKMSDKSNAKRSRTREKLQEDSRGGEGANCSDMQDFRGEKAKVATKKRKLFNLQKLAYTRKTKSLKSRTVASKVDEEPESFSTGDASSNIVEIEQRNCLGSQGKRSGEIVTVEDKVEENVEELLSSPAEPITIQDSAPDFNGVRCIEDLRVEHVEHLVWGMKTQLKDIFEGKTYSRRHEDYKKGGRSKGDLAFQVQFGLYSQDQQEAIMDVLVSIFCYKHSKYLDYITKVLLPETMISIYLKIIGGSRDEVERALFDTTEVPLAYGSQ